MKIGKEILKVYRVVFEEGPKEFVFAKTLEEATIIGSRAFAHRKIKEMEEIYVD